MTFLVGETVGPYRIIEQLGQGGMATVFKAYHPSLDRYVAIKVLHLAFLDDPNFIARFQREARVVARLHHPNIVPIFDFAEHGGRPYLVMQYIEGETLKANLEKKPLSLLETVPLIEAVGTGLAYAHKQGILHRDVKPSNVLLAKDGGIYLADFGLARIAQTGDSSLTADRLVGTPQYISPEQALSKPNLDARTDIYSFGVMVYELVVGKVPYNADTPFAIIHDHIYTPLPIPSQVNPSVPAAVERVLLKALAKQPEDRYDDVNAFVEAFKAAVAAQNLPTEIIHPANAPTFAAPPPVTITTPAAEAATQAAPANLPLAAVNSMMPEARPITPPGGLPPFMPPPPFQPVPPAAVKAAKKGGGVVKTLFIGCIVMVGVLIIVATILVSSFPNIMRWLGIENAATAQAFAQTQEALDLVNTPLHNKLSTNFPGTAQAFAKTLSAHFPSNPFARTPQPGTPQPTLNYRIPAAAREFLDRAVEAYLNKNLAGVMANLTRFRAEVKDNSQVYKDTLAYLSDNNYWLIAAMLMRDEAVQLPDQTGLDDKIRQVLYMAAKDEMAGDIMRRNANKPFFEVAPLRYKVYYGNLNEAKTALGELLTKPNMMQLFPEARLLSIEILFLQDDLKSARIELENLLKDRTLPENHWVRLTAQEIQKILPK